MTVTNKNFTSQCPPEIIDTEYIDCNFSQLAPVVRNGKSRGVKIFGEDSTPRIFRQCNLTNCEVPLGSTIENCLTVIKDFFIQKDIDRVSIDGKNYDVIKRVHKVHGRFDPVSKQYIDSVEELDL